MKLLKNKRAPKHENLVNKLNESDLNKRKEDNMENFTYVMILAYFGALFYIIQTFPYLDLKKIELLRFYCLFLAIGFLLPLKLYRKKFTMSIYEYLIFNILTFASSTFALFLILNASITVQKPIETYKIEQVKRIDGYTIYTLENNAYQEKEYLRKINDIDLVTAKGENYLKIHFKKGLFGIRSIDRKELY